MKAENSEEFHTEVEGESSDSGPIEPSGSAAAGSAEAAASEEGPSAGAGSPASASGADRQAARPAGVDAKKLQHAIENLVGRIAEARSRGAAGAGYPAGFERKDSAGNALDAEEDEPAWPDRGSEPRQASKPERNMDALELRMRQIAEIAGAPLAEDINADIAAIRGKMDRLSRDGGVLSNRMETIQRQLSNLRESVDTSSAPVVERLVELETRLEEIGEALASRHLSVEARTAVEHSCSHLLGAIARIEGLTRQAMVPDKVWDQIATVRARIDRLPTVDKIAGLDRRIHEVSERLGAVAEAGDRSGDFANLERRLSDMGASTKAALDEIRERPAYDPTDVRALLERIEAWRREKPASDVPAVGTKLDTIARKVDQLSRSEHTAALTKIQQGLRELTGVVSAQNSNLSGLDLPGLQRRLARICDELADVRDDSVTVDDDLPAEPVAAMEPRPLGPAFRAHQEEDEDQELAKRLAIRFAPEGRPNRDGDRGPSDVAGTASEDVTGAFDAVQTALEALVGQIPFIERTWDGVSRSAGPDKAAPPPTVAANKSSDWLAAASEPRDRPAANELLRSPARKPGGPVAPSASRAAATAVSSAAADTEAHSAPAGSGQPETDVSQYRPSTNYADAAHRIGRYSTWRKAKVAVVAANPPKY